MFTMFDLFRQAQGGAAFDNLARAYGMSPEQMRAAAAALTPAFMQGFQRQAQGDDGARRFAELFQTDAYARAFEAQAAALDPSARGAGEDALGAIFGSKEVSRAVAAQAAAASGVQAQIIRQVLPVLASILMGGFMKAAQGAGPAGASFGDAFGRMFGGQPKPEAATPQNPFQVWTDAMTRGAGDAANPMGDVMATWMKTVFGSQDAEEAPEPAPEKPQAKKAPPAEDGDRPAESAAASFDDFVATGRELSQQNAEAMERIFDAFFGAGSRASRD